MNLPCDTSYSSRGAASASMSNAVYELCPVTGRVLDKNRLLCPTQRSQRISMRARIGCEATSFGPVARIARESARTVFRTLIDQSRLDFVRLLP